jgi:hypothetical protein
MWQFVVATLARVTRQLLLNLDSQAVRNDIRYNRVEFCTVCAEERKHKTEGAIAQSRSSMLVNRASSFPFLSLAYTHNHRCCMRLTSHLHQRPIMLIGSTSATFPNHTLSCKTTDLRTRFGAKSKCANVACRTFPTEPHL